MCTWLVSKTVGVCVKCDCSRGFKSPRHQGNALKVRFDEASSGCARPAADVLGKADVRAPMRAKTSDWLVAVSMRSALEPDGLRTLRGRRSLLNGC